MPKNTRSIRATIASAAGILLMVAGLGFASPANAETSLPTPTDEISQLRAAVEGLSVEEQELYLSDEPKLVTLDPSTGEVVSVTVDDEAMIAPAAAYKNGCTSGRACWSGWLAPHALWGFSGTGTTYGSWPNRGNFRSGNYVASTCWIYAGNNPCGVAIPKNSTQVLGAEVTGTSVTLS